MGVGGCGGPGVCRRIGQSVGRLLFHVASSYPVGRWEGKALCSAFRLGHVSRDRERAGVRGRGFHQTARGMPGALLVREQAHCAPVFTVAPFGPAFTCCGGGFDVSSHVELSELLCGVAGGLNRDAGVYILCTLRK